MGAGGLAGNEFRGGGVVEPRFHAQKKPFCAVQSWIFIVILLSLSLIHHHWVEPCNGIRNSRTPNLPNGKNMTKIIKIRTAFMFKTKLNSFKMMLRKLLLACCTLLFLLEASSTSNVSKTKVVRTNEVFRSPFVKVFRRKWLSRPILCYHNSTLTQRIIVSGYIEPNPGPENLKKYPERKPQRKPSQNAMCETFMRTNTKRLSCIYCKNGTHLLYSSSI